MLTRRHLLFLPIASALRSQSFAGAALENARKLITAAKAQIGITVSYDPAYTKLSYPMGDVPRATGVCTDVVIRAYRDGLNIDLQKRVHEDMRKSFAAYPKIWGLKTADRNIDHRRVPNLITFFKRQGAVRKITEVAADYQAGDIVTMMLPGNLPHVALVSDMTTEDRKRPLLIHNIGGGTQEQDLLFKYPLTGHFRYALG